MQVERLTDEQVWRMMTWGDTAQPQPQDDSEDEGPEQPMQFELQMMAARQRLMMDDQPGDMPPTPWSSDDET